MKHTTDKRQRLRLLELAYQRGQEAVRAQRTYAPSNPYEEDENPALYARWEEGAIDAGLCDIYTNGVLNSARREA